MYYLNILTYINKINVYVYGIISVYTINFYVYDLYLVFSFK